MKPNLMKLRNFSLLFVFVFSIQILTAQYTDELNSNRPGNSQGAFSVGTNVLQFETGVSLGWEDHNLLQTETNAFVLDYAVRYGLFKEELEISLIGTFQSNNSERNLFGQIQEFSLANFRSNAIGAKYLLYDPYRKMEAKGPNLYSWKKNNKIQWADLIPAVSIYAGVNVDFINDPERAFVDPTFSIEESIELAPRAVLATQNNFMGGFVLVTNIIADRISSEHQSFGYIVTLTHTPTDWFSIFVENEGRMNDTYADQLFRGGAAVLITPDLQVDVSGVLNFKDTPSRSYARLGVSYRIDRHDTDEYIEEKGKAGRLKKKEAKNKQKERKKNMKNKRKEQKQKKRAKKTKTKTRTVEDGTDG